MTGFRSAAGLVTAILFLPFAVSAAPVVFVVRHAEKMVANDGDNDPALSAAGRQRAEALARMLKDAGVTAIFTTEFKRTQETAAPTAHSLGITATVVASKDTGALVSKLREVKGNALVVGHGNTIPGLVKALGVDRPVEIAENDYCEIFLITLADKPDFVRLHYPD